MVSDIRESNHRWRDKNIWKSYEFLLKGEPHKGISVVIEVSIEIFQVKEEENTSWVQTERLDETAASGALLLHFLTKGPV